MGVNYSPRIVTNGLVLCLDAANMKSYPGTGTVWTDLSGDGNNSTLVNGVGYSANNKGSLVFDGTNDFIELQSDILLGNNFTVSLLFKQTATRSDWVRLIGHSNDSSSRFWGLWMPAPRSYLLWQSYTGGGQVSSSAFTFELNTPYEIVLTSVGSLRSFYVNGNLLSSASNGGTINYTNNNSKITIGYAGFHTYYVGDLYSSKIYTRALSSDEIRQNFQALRGRFGI